jgi:X-Pro dipeptidyl-peptidase
MRLVLLALCLLGTFVVAARTPAHADPLGIVVSGGETQPVFGYTDAIRQRVWVETDHDSDANGLLAQWPLFLDNFFVPRG